MITVEVQYTCKSCGLDRMPVQVPARDSAQDIIWWMNNVCMPAVGVSHQQHSPTCLARNADVYLPIPSGTGGWVGGPQVN